MENFIFHFLIRCIFRCFFTFRFCSLNNSFFRIFRVALLFICQGSFILSVLFATAYLVYLTLAHLSSLFLIYFQTIQISTKIVRFICQNIFISAYFLMSFNDVFYNITPQYSCQHLFTLFSKMGNSSAFGFLLQASSHAKPLRGSLMHLFHYAVSRTLQQVQSPKLNCCKNGLQFDYCSYSTRFNKF